MTVNKVANCNTYPVSKTEDLLVTLNGAQKFAKIDLNQAHQPLLMDENSSDYLAIITHKDLFRPTRVQFRVHPAAGIFQIEMDSRLSHIPLTIVEMDGILISGKNSFDHKQHLVAVLKVSKVLSCGRKLRKNLNLCPMRLVIWVLLSTNMVFYLIMLKFAIY